MLDGIRYVECACDSNEHTLRFVLDKKADEIYVEMFLNPYLPWYERVWRALRYVFGYRCKYGHWDVTVLTRDRTRDLRAILDEFEGSQT